MLAANVDSVLLATSLNEDLNLRRLERYLTTAWDSGAEPVLVLTKADLHPDPEAARAEVESIAYGVPVIVVSVRAGYGLDEVAAIVRPGRTLVLLGLVGRRQVDARQHARRRGAARDERAPQRRPRPAHDLPSPARRSCRVAGS